MCLYIKGLYTRSKKVGCKFLYGGKLMVAILSMIWRNRFFLFVIVPILYVH